MYQKFERHTSTRTLGTLKIFPVRCARAQRRERYFRHSMSVLPATILDRNRISNISRYIDKGRMFHFYSRCGQLKST